MNARNVVINKNDIGVCIKNNEFFVLSQNDNCRSLCGSMEGKKCDKGCFKCFQIYQNTNGLNFIFDRIITISEDYFQIIVIKDSETVTTVQKPVGNDTRELLSQLSSFGLTTSEMNILKLKIFGFSNLEIAKLNFIALSTVKSHINHSLAKIPESLAIKIKNSKK
jgi:DNA-binding CsgD family transcriptional regulator